MHDLFSHVIKNKDDSFHNEFKFNVNNSEINFYVNVE